jgi:hypothetical protein
MTIQVATQLEIGLLGELNWLQNNSIFLDSIVNYKEINKILITALFTLKMTVTVSKIDSSQ